MFNMIYVTNKSGQSVYIRLQHEKLSATKPTFCHDIDNTKYENVVGLLCQNGFCVITPNQTTSFPTDKADGTRLYASLYAVSTLWIMDFEINCASYGCLFIKSKEDYNGRTIFYLYPANPKPVWIPDPRSQIPNILPLHVPITLIQICAWLDIGGNFHDIGELLIDTGHEFVRASAGDDVPLHGVISGVSEPEGSLYLGIIGGNMPCSISTEGGKIKSFIYGRRKFQSGEILVLTNDANI